MEKIQLVYIAPSGHSGSTLLDVILNQSTDTFSVGEFMFFDEWVKEDHKCSCNKNVSQCRFWHEIISSFESQCVSLRGPQKLVDRFTLMSSFSKAERKNYYQANHKLLSEVQTKSGARIIIDSSKSISRLKLLHSSGLFDIKVIHLIRNGWDYVSSGKKPKRRTSQEGDSFTKGLAVWRTALRWFLTNRILEKFIRKNDISYMLVRYEDLCNDTRNTISKLNEFLNLEIKENLTKLDLKDIHNISGSRWRHNDHLVIKSSSSFRDSNLSTLEKLSFNLIAGSLLRKYYNIED
ncbi:sulfotransferase [Ekhidna sp. To15]|uniref:sulfotransferase n=1 Tax=Ekhidna sp. To15 TaxID=3395267 RepID=UPI003F528F09